jgi:hypothetical protein
MNSTAGTEMDILVFVITTVVIGLVLIGFGLWGRSHVDSLLVDSKLGDRYDDDEYHRRANQLFRGSTWIAIFGTVFVIIGLAVYFLSL